MRIDRKSKKKLQVMAWKEVSGKKGSHLDHFWSMGYTLKLQPRRRPAPTDPTRKITWVLLEENPFSGSRYWLGIPRDIAEKALVLGFLPILEKTLA